MELLRSKAGERTVRLDPRTKMVMLFAVSTVLLLGGNGGTMFAVRTAMLLFRVARDIGTRTRSGAHARGVSRDLRARRVRRARA